MLCGIHCRRDHLYSDTQLMMKKIPYMSCDLNSGSPDSRSGVLSHWSSRRGGSIDTSSCFAYLCFSTIQLEALQNADQS